MSGGGASVLGASDKRGKCPGGVQMTWTRYKQGKLFKTQINDPIVHCCPKCLVLLAKIQERCRSRKYI